MNWENVIRTAKKFEEDFKEVYTLLRVEVDSLLSNQIKGKYGWEWFTAVYRDEITGKEKSICFPDVPYEEIRDGSEDGSGRVIQGLVIDGNDDWWQKEGRDWFRKYVERVIEAYEDEIKRLRDLIE